jgi:hypothetical protein
MIGGPSAAAGASGFTVSITSVDGKSHLTAHSNPRNCRKRRQGSARIRVGPEMPNGTPSQMAVAAAILRKRNYIYQLLFLITTFMATSETVSATATGRATPEPVASLPAFLAARGTPPTRPPR